MSLTKREKAITDFVIGYIDKSMARLETNLREKFKQIDSRIPEDHLLIPELAIANLKLLKSDIKAYCSNSKHKKSVIKEVTGMTPEYLRGLDK